LPENPAPPAPATRIEARKPVRRHTGLRRILNKPRNPILRRIYDFALIIFAAFLFSMFVKAFLIKSFYVPSGSMEPTLQVNDRIIVNELQPKLFELHRGDIIVFADPDHWLPATLTPPAANPFEFILVATGFQADSNNQHLVKRVIGLPGDHIVADGNGTVTLNGKPLQETYLPAGTHSSDIAFDVTVPAHSVWVMGDNRTNSADSRFHQDTASHGFVDTKYLSLIHI
jgi:signal peptidase I